jgi:hypothetical protein
MAAEKSGNVRTGVWHKLIDPASPYYCSNSRGSFGTSFLRLATKLDVNASGWVVVGREGDTRGD